MRDTVLYVYYKVPVAQHVELAPTVRQMQAALVAQLPGLHTQLLQRPEPSADGHETWMETYWHDAGLSPAMVDAIANRASTAQLPVPRRTEVFISLQ